MFQQRLNDFLDGHAFVHTNTVHPSEPFALPTSILEGLESDELRATPNSLNPIAWHLWHLACTEDFGASLVAAVPRLFDQQGWANPLKIAYRDAQGMTKQKAHEVGRQIHLGALGAYRDSVGARTRELLSHHEADYWFHPFTQSDLESARANAVISASDADAMGPFLLTQSRDALLRWWCLHHSLIHLGQATTLRHLLLAARG